MPKLQKSSKLSFRFLDQRHAFKDASVKLFVNSFKDPDSKEVLFCFSSLAEF